MLDLIGASRFDDVGEPEGLGLVDYAYQGWNYEIRGDDALFCVRTYDDEPGQCTVTLPADALALPEAAKLISFLRQRFGASQFRFYRPTLGAYALIDPETMQFK
jgi:hypothetical protein